MKFFILILIFIVNTCCAQQEAVPKGEAAVKSSFSDREKSYRSSPKSLLRSFSALQIQLESTGQSLKKASTEVEKLTLKKQFNSLVDHSMAFRALLQKAVDQKSTSGFSPDELSSIKAAVSLKLPPKFELPPELEEEKDAAK